MVTRLLLADDHVVVRQAFKALLEQFGFEIVAEAADGEEAVQLARAERPDVAVLDIRMPKLDGLSAAQAMLAEETCRAVVLLTGYADDARAAHARAAGVQGYVLKVQATEELVEAIRAVCRGERYVSPAMTPLTDPQRFEPAPPPTILTPREREVLRLIAVGKSTREVADLLGVSYKTIDAHRANIMGKLDLHKVADLVRYAVRRGLVEP